MKVILMHGKDTDPSQKWYPWFGRETEKLGYQCVALALPNPSDPVMDEWLAKLNEADPDKETILVGHSRGGVAILRWLERQPAEMRVKKVILIAVNSGALADRAIQTESNHGFYTEAGYDFEKIKSHCNDFVVLHSRDDKWVPFSDGMKNSSGLAAKFLKLDDRGHFGKGVDEIPELIEEIPIS